MSNKDRFKDCAVFRDGKRERIIVIEDVKRGVFLTEIIGEYTQRHKTLQDAIDHAEELSPLYGIKCVGVIL